MFSRPNPFDECVAAATNENLTAENWELILAVTDKITRSSPESARDCIAAIEKRLNNKNPNVQLYAVALTEALIKNCDTTAHREISSRAFTNTLTKLVHERDVHAKVKMRILEFIQMCSFEFRADSALGLMNEVYHSLRAEGFQFPSPQKPKKEFTQSELDKQKEEEEFQLALALSLSESENRPSYKAAAPASTAVNNNSKPKESKDETPQISRVRALYDFQPTEQGELGFEKGDIIRVIESVYRDWWKGELRGKTGIFPVNYVEKITDPSPSDLLKEASVENEVLNETQNIDRLLEMLSSTDPRLRDTFSDNEELQNMYNSTLSIRPKLVKLIEKYSLKKDELVALNEKFMQARTMYDGMLSNSIARYSSGTGPYGYPPTGHQSYGSGSQQHQGYAVNNYGYPDQSYGSAGAPPQQQSYGYPSQQQSPAPLHQNNSYGGENTPTVPQALPQQQQQYEYNAQQPQQGQYQNTYEPQQQQQAAASVPDYSYSAPVQSTYNAPSEQQHNYTQPPSQQQQSSAAYSPAPATEGYHVSAATNYSSPPPTNGQQQYTGQSNSNNTGNYPPSQQQQGYANY